MVMISRISRPGGHNAWSSKPRERWDRHLTVGLHRLSAWIPLPGRKGTGLPAGSHSDRHLVVSLARHQRRRFTGPSGSEPHDGQRVFRGHDGVWGRWGGRLEVRLPRQAAATVIPCRL